MKTANTPQKRWSDASLLQSIPNPAKGYEIKLENPEITFLGVKDQPDFATAYLTFYPAERVIELKSLKKYFQQFRNTVISYERLLNVIYDDLMAVYKPERLRLVMKFRARGGIRARLVKDSDWKILGGKEKFRDWVGQSEEW